jgi:dGTP triphosphohydrolase
MTGSDVSGFARQLVDYVAGYADRQAERARG